MRPVFGHAPRLAVELRGSLSDRETLITVAKDDEWTGDMTANRPTDTLQLCSAD